MGGLSPAQRISKLLKVRIFRSRSLRISHFLELRTGTRWYSVNAHRPAVYMVYEHKKGYGWGVSRANVGSSTRIPLGCRTTG